MLTIIKEILAVLIGVYIISQIILPCFIPNLEFFNLHKKRKLKPNSQSAGTLNDLEEKATVASEKIKEVKTEVESTEQKISNIKNKINN